MKLDGLMFWWLQVLKLSYTRGSADTSETQNKCEQGAAPNGYPRHASCFLASLGAGVAPRVAVGELGRSAKNMRAISRHLPLIPPAKTPRLAWGILALFIFGLLIWGYFQPLVFAFIGAVIILCWISGIYEKKRINKMKMERSDTICDFRRAFDIHRVDPYIIRASYQEIGRYLDSESGFPLRAADDFTRDLKIDGEDLDDIACDVAKRLNYDMDTCQQNPLYGKVKTVRDFVMFFTHKPSTTE